MQQSSKFWLTVSMTILLVVTGGLGLLKGSLYVAGHEGDTLYIVDMILRMEQGQSPHQDFITPLGIMALAPIALLVQWGLEFGKAILAAQLLVGMAILPAALWAGYSRMGGKWAYVFVSLVVIFCTALMYGSSIPSSAFSMFYNRWCWAISFVVLAIAILDPIGRPRPVLDGVIIGLGMSWLVLIKVTFFLALCVPVAVALLTRKQYKAIAGAFMTGLLVVLMTTLIGGVAFWLGYVDDLLTVAQSNVRPFPDKPLMSLLIEPPYIAPMVIILSAVILLRQSGQQHAGLVMLLLIPGFVYVTYQNFGNDPHWLFLVGIFVFLLRPAAGTRNEWGWDLRLGLTVLGVAAFAHEAPTAINMAFSTPRHFGETTQGKMPMLFLQDRHQDLIVGQTRQMTTNAAAQPVDVPWPDPEQWDRWIDRSEPVVFRGEALPNCELAAGGLVGWNLSMTKDLENAGYAGEQIFVADLFNALWLYGDFPAVRGVAPWSFGKLSGLEEADYVVVPLCVSLAKVRAEIVDELEVNQVPLTEVRRTSQYILLKKVTNPVSAGG